MRDSSARFEIVERTGGAGAFAVYSRGRGGGVGSEPSVGASWIYFLVD
jgi:hypothetical protein